MNRGARFLLRIAGRIVPETEREWMLGDLEEEHARLEDEFGARVARQWLLKETIRLTVDSVRLRSDQ